MSGTSDFIIKNLYPTRGVAVYHPNQGDTISFWDDIIGGTMQSEKFPHLLHFVKDPTISVCSLRHAEHLIDQFRIPMTRAAYNEFLELQEFLSSLPPIDLTAKDSRHFIWGQHRYFACHFYQYQFRELRPSKSILWIWESKCIPKIKFFAWLLLNDRLNTRNMLKRRRKVLEEGYNWVMCQYSVEETIEHLFFDCPSTVCRWFAIGFVWEENLNIHQKLYQAKRDFGQPFFMEVFMIGAWCLWNRRNEVIFDGKAPCLAAWKVPLKLRS
jgi:hypothetical protein